MKKTILTLILAAMCVSPALADAAFDREYYPALAAFQTTSASEDASCHSMLSMAGTSMPDAQDGSPWYVELAFVSRKCLNEVQAETGVDSLPSKFPRWMLVGTCVHVRFYMCPKN
jgi:hypothetical protein